MSDIDLLIRSVGRLEEAMGGVREDLGSMCARLENVESALERGADVGARVMVIEAEQKRETKALERLERTVSERLHASQVVPPQPHLPTPPPPPGSDLERVEVKRAEAKAKIAEAAKAWAPLATALALIVTAILQFIGGK